jgi:hypothetical protein
MNSREKLLTLNQKQMAKRINKRINKTKGRIVSEIQQTQDADRRRALINDIVFPYLIDMNESIEYSKIFLQAFSGLIEGVYEERRKVTTVGDIKLRVIEKLKESFPHKDMKDELKRYTNLAEKLDGISIQDLSYALELPRYLDGFMVKETGKEKISKVDIKKILG